MSKKNKSTKGQRRKKGQQNSRKHNKMVKHRPDRILKRKKQLELIMYQTRKKQLEEINKIIKEQSPKKEEVGIEK